MNWFFEQHKKFKVDQYELEERAAIMQYNGGMSLREAETSTVKLYEEKQKEKENG